MLDGVLRLGRSLDDVAPAALKPLRLPEDRALAHAITGEVLRWLGNLDAAINSATAQRLDDNARPRMVLRMMLAQALRLDTPPHAVIATSLPLLSGGPRRLAHGVFGTLMRRSVALGDRPLLPDAIAARWHDAWGPAVVTAAQGSLATPPPLDLAWRDAAFAARDPASPEGISLAARHLRLPRGGSVEALPGYADGDWWVQDLAASVPARLLAGGNGRRVLDLCAAPGGKTMQLADAGWQVTAVDQSASRIRRLRANLDRAGLVAETVVADLRDWQPAQPADAVLLDAPCSATGIFRRHPDVLYRAGSRDIAALAEIQSALLDRAAQWVRPGGTLVYAVCSLEPQEGEAQIARFLERHAGYCIEPITAGELPAGIAPTPERHFRALPGMLADAGGLDGFFAARLVRAN